MNLRKRRLMEMRNALHLESLVDCLYIPRKEKARTLSGIEEIVNVSSLGLEIYLKEITEHLLVVRRTMDNDSIEISQDTVLEAKK